MKKHKNGTVKLVWKRDNKLISKQVKVDETGKIGFAPIITNKSEIVNESYGLFGSLAEGAKRTINFGAMFINSIKQIFNGNISAKESLGGPIMIAQLAGESARSGLATLLGFMAIISVNLGFVNILPIPALDGGHVMFLMYEIISGRKPSDKFLEYAQVVGMVLLFSLLIYANGNDIIKLFQ